MVFLVNKVDILASDAEVAEVVDFVADNAGRLLGVETAQVLPVASRRALAAKTSVGGTLPGGGCLGRPFRCQNFPARILYSTIPTGCWAGCGAGAARRLTPCASSENP